MIFVLSAEHAEKASKALDKVHSLHRFVQLEGIYRLHLQNSELPLQYSTLLHLRQILNLSNKKAEQLEGDLKDSAYAFSI